MRAPFLLLRVFRPGIPSKAPIKQLEQSIAHKLTGAKVTAFTARYINKFHEMVFFRLTVC